LVAVAEGLTMPRVIPKTKEFADHLDERERIRDAAHDYADETKAALDRVARKHDLPLTVRERSAYGPGAPFSFFRDLASVAADNAAVGAGIADGDPRATRMVSPEIPSRIHGSTDEARARLATVGVERRDLSSTLTAGGNFVLNFTPTAAPGYVGRAFAAAVRQKAVVANLLHHEPLPPSGVKVETTRLTTGTAVAVQASDNAAVQETDLVEALVTSNIATLQGIQDMSQQLFDRADPASSMDVVLATDLGNALAIQLDQQILYGTGASGQLRGFVNVTGITAVTKTNGTPTGLTNLLALGDLTAQTATAYGQLPDTLLVSPRRLAYMRAKIANQIEWPARNVVSTPVLHTTDGASTNQDEAFVIASDEIWLFGGEPRFRVFAQPGSGTLTARFVADMYAGLLAHRMPAAIGRVSGTEWTAPVFT
jgi:HK97 family phage major capsid protein